MSLFHFKQFSIDQSRCAMKISTDATLLGAWTKCDRANSILDIGCGTGLLALMLAQKNDKAKITAVDCDMDAYLQAGENFLNSPWSDRISAVYNKIQDYRPETLYDLIICNPPYYPEKKFLNSPDPQKKVARYDSMLNFHELTESVSLLLNWDGYFNLILPVDVAGEFIQIALGKGLFLNSKASVFTKVEKKSTRTMMRFSKTQSEIQTEDIFIRKKNEEETVYSAEYQHLLRDFLTIF